MKRTKRSTLIALVVAIILSACSLPFRVSTPHPDSDPTSSEAWQEQVDAIRA